MSPILFGMVLPWLLLAVGCWLAYQLVRQNGRILLRLEALEAGLRQLPEAGETSPGLAVGTAAPAFELPDLAGGRQALGQYRGRRVLLIFFNPECSFCVRMAPDLALLPLDGKDGRPVPLVVSTGGAEENRRLVQEYGIRCGVLLEGQREVSSKYQAAGTPTGYLLDENGFIASELAVGAEALLALAAAPGGQADQGERGAAVRANGKKPRGKANRGLHTSHIQRDGLKAGTPAPAFRLPLLDGGELALEALRGRRVLLVFSDPECGPCDQLAPHLERTHRENPALRVLMVSRGDAEVNRRKVKEHGLTFPVVLQRQWEVSRRYAMFATPIAYLIDEQGVIAADVAVGVEPILSLLSGSPATANHAPDGRRLENGVPAGAESA
jgi:peroxiredoxin